MNSFSKEIGGKGININWFVKFRVRLDKVKEEQKKKKVAEKASGSITLSGNF